MALLATGLVVTAVTTDGYGTLLLGLILMGAGCALAIPAIVEAVMSAIPPHQAGAGAGVDGAMSELGSSLGVATLGAVLHARLAALHPVAQFPAAQSLMLTGEERLATAEAFAASLETGQVTGAAAVLIGGFVTAVLLRRADR